MFCWTPNWKSKFWLWKWTQTCQSELTPEMLRKWTCLKWKTIFIARLSTTLDMEKSQHKIYVYPAKWLQRFHCRGDFIHDELLLRSYLGKFRHQRKHLKSVWVLIKTRCWLTRRKAKLKRASAINNLVKLRSVEPPPSFQDMAVIPWTPSSLKTTSSPSSSRPPIIGKHLRLQIDTHRGDSGAVGRWASRASLRALWKSRAPPPLQAGGPESLAIFKYRKLTESAGTEPPKKKTYTRASKPSGNHENQIPTPANYQAYIPT